MGKCWNCKNDCPKNLGKRSAKHFCSDKCYLMYRTEITESCWLSKTCIRKDGYSAFQINKKEVLAHRLSYQIFRGEIPSEKLVCHICDVRNCVNPDHLYIGTDKTNAIDRQKRNKSTSQQGSKNHRALLNEGKVKDIRKMLEKGYKGFVLAKYFGVTATCISNIKTAKIWKHI